MTNPEIGAWRATLDGVNRRKLNHPNKVIDRWRRATQVRDTEPKKPSPSLSQALKDRDKVIEQLNERNKELQEEREGGDGAMVTIDQVLAAFIELMQDEPASVVQATMNRLKKEFTEAWKRRRQQGAALREPEKRRRAGYKRKKGPKVIANVEGLGPITMEDE
jgi:hypothetical protein